QTCMEAIGPGRAGETCANHADCASGFCLEEQQVCFGGCDLDEHCTGSTACVDLTFEGGSAPGCLPTCTDDAACPANRTCLPVLGHRGLEIAAVCTPGMGQRAAGSACDNDSQCRSGGCIDGFCFGVCDEASDCAG